MFNLNEKIFQYKLRKLAEQQVMKSHHSEYSIHSKEIDENTIMYLNTSIKSRNELSYEDVCYHSLRRMLEEMLHDLVKYHLVDVVSKKNVNTGVITYECTLKIVTEDNKYVTFINDINEAQKEMQTHHSVENDSLTGEETKD